MYNWLKNYGRKGPKPATSDEMVNVAQVSPTVNIVDLKDEQSLKEGKGEKLTNIRVYEETGGKIKEYEIKGRLAEQKDGEKLSVKGRKRMSSLPLSSSLGQLSQNSLDEKLKFIRNNLPAVISVSTPFGFRNICYADYTASGRSLTFIEEYINTVVVPLYANTHTETSATGLQSTYFREESRNLILNSFGVNKKEYSLLFTGSGSTAAFHKFISLLGINIPAKFKRFVDNFERKERPLVFISCVEHHSNYLMWKESLAEVIVIPTDSTGSVCLETLEKELIKNYDEFGSERMVIGSFTVGSNVTGLRSCPYTISQLLHKYKGISCFDLAAAGPYVDIDLNGSHDMKDSHIDVVFVSPHKYVGGPGTPGLLILRRNLFDLDPTEAPTIPGGGTVAVVWDKGAIYEGSLEGREEAGTPGVIESIRCGLVFQLKEHIGAQNIENLEGNFAKRAIDRLHNNPNVWIIGGDKTGIHSEERLSITSFNIYVPWASEDSNKLHKRLLHPHFVAALLNDLYGIQARSGCSCAGPLGFEYFDSSLLGEDFVDSTIHLARRDFHSIKPGWCRVNFNYFITEEEFDFILTAIEQIANHGWKLLPLYALCLKTGQYWYNNNSFDRFNGIRTLKQIKHGSNNVMWETSVPAQSTTMKKTLETALEIYDGAKEKSEAILYRFRNLRRNDVPFPTNLEKYRWFLLGTEALERLGITTDNITHVKETDERTHDQTQNPEIVAKPVTNINSQANPMLTMDRPRG